MVSGSELAGHDEVERVGDDVRLGGDAICGSAGVQVLGVEEEESICHPGCGLRFAQKENTAHGRQPGSEPGAGSAFRMCGPGGRATLPFRHGCTYSAGASVLGQSSVKARVLEDLCFRTSDVFWADASCHRAGKWDRC